MKKITFTLHLRIPSKKNNKQWIWRGNRKYLVPSDNHRRFCYQAKNEIHDQLKRYEAITTPVNVYYEFYLKNNGKRQGDTSNMMTTIDDLLQDVGIIEDDDQVLCGTFYKQQGAKEWSATITVTEVQINVLKPGHPAGDGINPAITNVS